MREQLANVPKPVTQIEAAAEAAEIPERSLIAAVGVRTQRGQYRLPEMKSPVQSNTVWDTFVDTFAAM